MFQGSVGIFLDLWEQKNPATFGYSFVVGFLRGGVQGGGGNWGTLRIPFGNLR